jgi:Ras-related protein Rab-1A
VGKSSIVSRFAEDTYESSFISTIGVDFKVHSHVVDGRKVKLQIWDTAGQDRFRAITSTYYRGAHAVCLVYDRSDITTLENADALWMREVRRYARPTAPVLLVGNKADLLPTEAQLEEAVGSGGAEATSSEEKEAQREAAREMDEMALALLDGERHGDRMCSHVTTSAKTGAGVEGMFEALSRKLLEQSSDFLHTASPEEVQKRGVKIGKGRKGRWVETVESGDTDCGCIIS